MCYKSDSCLFFSTMESPFISHLSASLNSSKHSTSDSEFDSSDSEEHDGGKSISSPLLLCSFSSSSKIFCCVSIISFEFLHFEYLSRMSLFMSKKDGPQLNLLIYFAASSL